MIAVDEVVVEGGDGAGSEMPLSWYFSPVFPKNIRGNADMEQYDRMEAHIHDYQWF